MNGSLGILRKADELLWKIKAIAIVVIFAGFLFVVLIKDMWTVQVDKPIDTGQGIVQRAAAFDKLINQAGSMDSEIPKKFVPINRVHGWLAEISTMEVKFATEFIDYSVERYDVLNNENMICGTLSHDLDNGYDSDEIRIAEIVSHDLNGFVASEADTSKQLLTQVLVRKFPCK